VGRTLKSRRETYAPTSQSTPTSPTSLAHYVSPSPKNLKISNPSSSQATKPSNIQLENKKKKKRGKETLNEPAEIPSIGQRSHQPKNKVRRNLFPSHKIPASTIETPIQGRRRT